MQEDFMRFYKYIEQYVNEDMDFVILGDYELMDLVLSSKEETRRILKLVEEGNIWEVWWEVGSCDGVVELLRRKRRDELDLVSEVFG